MAVALTSHVAHGSHQLVYDVSGRVNMPKHGLVRTQATAMLAEVRPGLLRLDIEATAVLDEHGSARPFPAHLSLERHPFFFRRDETGSVSEVLHHPEEHESAVGAKKTYASMHQWVGPRAGGRSSHQKAWTVSERDSAGDALASYSVTDAEEGADDDDDARARTAAELGQLRLRKHSVYHASDRWTPRPLSQSRPHSAHAPAQPPPPPRPLPSPAHTHTHTHATPSSSPPSSSLLSQHA